MKYLKNKRIIIRENQLRKLVSSIFIESNGFANWAAGAPSNNHSNLKSGVGGFEAFAKRASEPEDEFEDEFEDDPEDYYEADPPSSLGRIAFAPQRKNRGIPHEDNLPAEQKLVDDLREYINQAGKDLSDDSVKILLDILKNDTYSDVILEPSPSSLLYRGILVSEKLMEKICEDAGIDINDIGRGAEYRVDYVFQPKKGFTATSWTSYEKIAEDFTINPSLAYDIGGNVYGIVMTAKASDNPDKFLDLQKLYDISNTSNYAREEETVAFGDIKINKISIVRTYHNAEKLDV